MVTVFTPIYNRAYIVSQLYQSLLRQTNFDFEWLIIDDGSTDNIAELADQWLKCTKEFEVRFYQQPNGGKHRAINKGVQLAKGDAFLIVDSDDYLMDDAIDTVLNYWSQIKNSTEFAGVSGLRMYPNMQIIGGRPQFDEYVDATNLERTEYGLDGDKAEVYKTDILKKFPFPEFRGETFVTESVVWNELAYQGYKIRWFNKGIVVCEYLEDGLTANSSSFFIQNPRGWAISLSKERIYRGWSENFYFKQCYKYYAEEHFDIKNDEMRELLKIDNEWIRKLEKIDFELKKQFEELCRDKTVSIYAYGVWGKRLKRYLDELNICIEYIVDRKCLDTGKIARYDLKSDLPPVDIVFVALKRGIDDVVPILTDKLKNSKIVILKEIVEGWW